MEKRSPSETIMKVMEDFGGDEPEELIVIWTTKAGDIAWSSTTEHISLRIGMLEFAKACILHGATHS
jgi:hypothetical protein